MGIEQTNFLHIFDDTGAEKKLDSSDSQAEIIKEDVHIEDISNEKKEYLISEALINREEEIKKEAERSLKRLRLIQTNDDIPLASFKDIMPEIKAYEIRLSMLRAAYNRAAPGEDKQRAYLVLVSPEINDDEAYRDSARLYFKYLEASKIDAKQQAIMKSKKTKGKKKTLANAPVKPEIDKTEREIESGDDVNDAPDPYGDIYPYSRKWRKN
ncbi:MAG: hypothetical protein PHE20_00975 [Patescibacteria group bacterium]|nr:hypothetical protein [Patescibacteria group bacterium]